MKEGLPLSLKNILWGCFSVPALKALTKQLCVNWRGSWVEQWLMPVMDHGLASGAWNCLSLEAFPGACWAGGAQEGKGLGTGLFPHRLCCWGCPQQAWWLCSQSYSCDGCQRTGLSYCLVIVSVCHHQGLKVKGNPLPGFLFLTERDCKLTILVICAFLGWRDPWECWLLLEISKGQWSLPTESLSKVTGLGLCRCSWWQLS